MKDLASTSNPFIFSIVMVRFLLLKNSPLQPPRNRLKNQIEYVPAQKKDQRAGEWPISHVEVAKLAIWH
jgi:hypothetical protein